MTVPACAFSIPIVGRIPLLIPLQTSKIPNANANKILGNYRQPANSPYLCIINEPTAAAVDVSPLSIDTFHSLSLVADVTTLAFDTTSTVLTEETSGSGTIVLHTEQVP